jgi:hypothetical protein
MQMPQDNNDPDEKALEAPPRLISALKRTPKPAIFIPPTVDEAILHVARKQLSRQTERRFKWPFLMRWGIAFAAVVSLLVITPLLVQNNRTVSMAGAVPGDLNHDGQVDILDAFALARQLKESAQSNLQLDMNGDGVVDERDVATLAARAVSLGKGGRS